MKCQVTRSPSSVALSGQFLVSSRSVTGGVRVGPLRSRGDRGLRVCRARVVLRWLRSGLDANALTSPHLR
jgi:hypothetical protein